MFNARLIFSALRSTLKPALNLNNSVKCIAERKLLPHTFGLWKNYTTALLQNVPAAQRTLLSNPSLIQISNEINSRTVIKYSIRKGKRKTARVVLTRFYRLHWGGWIRTIAGRHRRIWAKSTRRRMRVQQHVLCNSTQSTLLDKMVNNYWRRPKYYVDDPYEPYHTREECKFTYKKPKPYYPPE